ncbi:hypothetical protein ACFPOI_39760 [Nonomuraea angiospora]|uniref:Uncharacterized protein n=1 Tax=Nonomuraea angiospora TaxID=46172 RepID=A0ABR9M4Q2_9ACTN|nr:hypothetical protein [Nonomuraea angiospora]MBE1587873.1 hypothetical protein [Nonomuraea angiospora]
MRLSPLAQRLLHLIDGTANDPTRRPDASQLNVGLTGVAGSAPGRYATDERARRQLAAPARELVGFLLPEDRTWPYGRFPALVAAGLAGMDAEVGARPAEGCGPIAAAGTDCCSGGPRCAGSGPSPPRWRPSI